MGPEAGVSPVKDMGPEAGIPPERTWDQRLGRDLGPETRVPPRCGQTDKVKTLPSPVLGMRPIIKVNILLTRVVNVYSIGCKDTNDAIFL